MHAGPEGDRGLNVPHKAEGTVRIMSETTSADRLKKNFYRESKIAEIKEISILDVCRLFGIRVDFRGREPKCSIRSEKDPSTVLHTEDRGRFRKNTYHDFGTNETGDNIALACRLMGLDRSRKEDWYKAVDYLATSFHISPEGRSTQNTGELSDREYMLLGLYGDRATKNFRFDPDRQSPEQMSKISAKYSLPMNELKKKHPRIFARLLKTIAIPRLREARNEYYIHIWDTRRFLRAVMGENADITDIEQFNQMAKELRAMEGALSRAMIGTELTAPAKADYDPKTILERIDSGKLQPDFGNKTKNQLTRIAETCKTVVKYRAADFASVYYRGEEHFKDIPYSAFLNSKGQAIVRYLEKDEERLDPIFREICPPKEKRSYKRGPKRLNDKLDDAHHRQSTQKTAAFRPNAHGVNR